MKIQYLPFGQASTLSISELEMRLETQVKQGLNQKESDVRKRQIGPNILQAHQQTVWKLIGRQFQSVFVWLLIFASGLSFFLGVYLDAVLILIFVAINVILTFFQEYKSHHILESLKKYFVSHTLVLRAGVWKDIFSTDLVPGDVIQVEPGDVLPADIRFIESMGLIVNESILTGESESVEKNAEVLLMKPKSLFVATNMGFAATHVLSGTGKGMVIATGVHSAAGSTIQLATETKRESSFEQAMNRFSVFMIKLVGVTLAVLFLLHFLIKGPSIQVGELLIFFIALAVSVVPEALPVVFTFALSSGAAHLAKKKVVVKRLASIEDLGQIEILCTDKTGTITEGKMTLAEVYDENGRALLTARMGMEPKKIPTDIFDRVIDQAFKPFAKKADPFEVLQRTGFDPQHRVDLSLVQSKQVHVILRGAPENVLARCLMSAAEQKKAMQWMEQQGQNGRRVLAVAEQVSATVPTNWEKTKGMTFVGMLAFEDPLKPTSIMATKKAQALGIRVMILTGDRPEVAGAIAQQMGLIQGADEVMTGEALFALSATEQVESINRVSVFARVTPVDKLNIIRLLKEHARVGFLGEGINDAPALKEAHVGIVVQHASDIAREAADIVLLKKSLFVILEGVEHGRKVSVNTMKYIKTTLASNFGNFYSVAIASLFIPYLPMLPIQILLVNLLSDFPMIAIASDTVDLNDLKKPTRVDLREIGFVTTFFGSVSSVFDFILFGVFLGSGAVVLQTAWFIQSIVTELVAIISLRTRKWFFLTRPPGKVLSILLVGAVAITLLLPSVSVTRNLFSFTALSAGQFLFIGLIIAGYFVATELTKQFFYRMLKTNTFNQKYVDKTI